MHRESPLPVPPPQKIESPRLTAAFAHWLTLHCRARPCVSPSCVQQRLEKVLRRHHRCVLRRLHRCRCHRPCRQRCLCTRRRSFAMRSPRARRASSCSTATRRSCLTPPSPPTLDRRRCSSTARWSLWPQWAESLCSMRTRAPPTRGACLPSSAPTSSSSCAAWRSPAASPPNGVAARASRPAPSCGSCRARCAAVWCAQRGRRPRGAVACS